MRERSSWSLEPWQDACDERLELGQAAAVARRRALRRQFLVNET